jgi:hypothetical protein
VRGQYARAAVIHQEHAIGLQEKIAEARATVDGRDRLAVDHQQADGPEVRVVHAGVHGEQQCLVAGR